MTTPYLNVLKKVLNEGVYLPDRTGTGRYTVFGVMERFDLSKGLPIDTTRKLNIDSMVKELIWFISGSTNIELLRSMGVNFWNQWELNDESFNKAIDKYTEVVFQDQVINKLNEEKLEYLKSYDVDEIVEFNSLKDILLKKNYSEEQANSASSYYDKYFNVNLEEMKQQTRQSLIEFSKDKKGTIGPMYGHFWRNCPIPYTNIYDFWPEVTEDMIASDKLAIYKAEYEKAKQDDETITYKKFLKYVYYSNSDQLAELINNLKNNPNSRRHIVSSWIPGLLPFERLPPEENVFLGKGALTACHMMFQCFLAPAKDENSKPKLSLLIYIRSNDLVIGAGYNIGQYAMLTHLLAHVIDADVGELIWNVGDAHIYSNHVEKLKEQLERPVYPYPTIRLNPDKKDIFAFTAEDIVIENYQHHPHINYQLAK